MNEQWKQADGLIRSVAIRGSDQNEPVSIISLISGLRCIGIGTDAAVFQAIDLPDYAFKVYAPQSLNKKSTEEVVYDRLNGSAFFPHFHGSGDNYIVLSYESGITLYDCLIQGVTIPEQAIRDVEDARSYVRNLGLNPRDIHLKNVLLQDGRGKVLDVSEYVLPGNDNRWEHLEWGYYRLYPMIDGVKIPSWILNTVKHWYNRADKANFALEEFSQQVMKMFLGNKK